MAIARPIPRLPPVTSADLPSIRISISCLPLKPPEENRQEFHEYFQLGYFKSEEYSRSQEKTGASWPDKVMKWWMNGSLAEKYYF
jgi:hypothetical protein